MIRLQVLSSKWAHLLGRFGLASAVVLSLTGVVLGQLNPVPAPIDVPGKAISDGLITGDQDSQANPDPHLTREWVGDSNTSDSTDYSNSLVPFQALPGEDLQDVDALANTRDYLFKRVTSDDATLLVSPVPLQNAVGGGLNEIYYHTDSANLATPGVWAKNFPDIGGANNPPGTDTPPEGIDGLEVWGASDDHNLFSLYDDPGAPGGPKISVFIHDIVNDVSSAYILNDQIRAAIGLGPGDLEIDLDGMMVHDKLGDGVFGVDDSIMFTVEENQSAGGPFHGGEIWVWDFGSPAANFLVHGGITWDSINLPSAVFGWGGAPDLVNDINALEAIYEVPEPSSLLLISLALVVGGRIARLGRVIPC